MSSVFLLIVRTHTVLLYFTLLYGYSIKIQYNNEIAKKIFKKTLVSIGFRGESYLQVVVVVVGDDDGGVVAFRPGVDEALTNGLKDRVSHVVVPGLRFCRVVAESFDKALDA